MLRSHLSAFALFAVLTGPSACTSPNKLATCPAVDNEVGIGGACSSAADCVATGVCSASLVIDVGRDFCTKPCTSQADCGSGAICVQLESGGTCVPACLGADAGDTGSGTTSSASASSTSGGSGSTGGTLSVPVGSIPSTTGGTGGGTTGAIPATCVGNPSNTYGVGAPCQAGGGSCTKQANSCAADYDPALPAVCSMPCGSDMTDCGPGASCAQNPQNPNVFVCVMTQCVWVNASTKPTQPRSACLPLQNNAQNVGKMCTSNADCPGANNLYKGCTNGLAIKPATPPPYNFCTVGLCTSDAACGTGARCVVAPGMTEKTCVPSSCLP